MLKATPTLRFNDGKCREAMEFYKKCFGAKVEFMTLGESPMGKDFPDKAGLIMHSRLTKGNLELIGSDMMRDRAVVGDAAGITVECESEQQVHDFFNKLAEGGEVFMKPEEQFWGGIYGMLTDKYGIEWSLNFQKVPMK